MKPLARPRGVVALAIVSMIVLVGCTAPERTQFRVDRLEEFVAEFDADSVAEVLCEYDGGEAGALTQLNHSWVLSGATAFELVDQRLAELQYDVRRSPGALSALRGGAYAAAYLIEDPGTQPELESALQERGCEIPADGAVLVTIAEDGTSDVGPSQTE